MEYTYQFINGEYSVVEIDENTEWGRFILESDRLEHNQDNREHYRCWPLFSTNERKIELADYAEPYDLMLKKAREESFNAFFEELECGLTETQRRRLDMREEGLGLREIARTEGKRLMAIQDSLEQIGKKYVALRKKFPR